MPGMEPKVALSLSTERPLYVGQADKDDASQGHFKLNTLIGLTTVKEGD